MNTTATLEQLNDLKLAGMARSYQAILQMPLNQHPEAHALIAQLTQAEKQNRIKYKTQIYLKLSKLRYTACWKKSRVAKNGTCPKNNSSNSQIVLIWTVPKIS